MDLVLLSKTLGQIEFLVINQRLATIFFNEIQKKKIIEFFSHLFILKNF